MTPKEEARGILAEAFKLPRTPRSDAYKAGILAAVEYRLSLIEGEIKPGARGGGLPL